MQQNLDVQRFAIPGLLLLKSPVHHDARGDLVEVYQESAYLQSGVTDVFVQDNLCTSQRGVVRGLHFQLPPAAQAKLVRVLQGEVFDVVLDLREDSPAYLTCETMTLTEGSGTLYVPRGCAHGFGVVSVTATVLYKLSAEYAPELECGVNWRDPALGLAWPFDSPIVSQKDAALPGLEEMRQRLAQARPVW